jgi:hypothetical protein
MEIICSPSLLLELINNQREITLTAKCDLEKSRINSN